MNGIRKAFLSLAVLLLCLLGASAATAEARITFTPEKPRKGDYVDVTVTPEREGVQDVIWQLSTPEGAINIRDKNKKKDSRIHLTGTFRPREETEYTLTVTLVYGKKDKETVSVSIPVSEEAPPQEGADVVYSQKDGWWHKVIYSKDPYETLERGGCAIFSLSHILQRYGVTGEEVQPAALASRYSRFYIRNRGTDNEGLINKNAETYGFITQPELITTEREAVQCLKRGDLFTFGIVLGHIAMVDGVSEDGTLVHVVDSAPGATFERKNRFKTKGHVFYQNKDGSFTEAETIDQLPGIRWFFETEDYGGMAYWMDLKYCLTYNKHAGLRLIRRPWLEADGAPVTSLEYAGAMMSRVTTGSSEEAARVPTKDLTWTTEGADGPRIAVITNKKGANLLDGDGNKLEKYSNKLPVGAMMAVLSADKDLCYVFWKDIFCYISAKDVNLIPVETGSFKTGILSANGKTAGTTKVTLWQAPKAKNPKVAQLTIGTPVAIADTNGEFVLVEAKGYRGWVHQKYLTRDAE